MDEKRSAANDRVCNNRDAGGIFECTQTTKYEFMLMKYSNYEVWIYAHEVLKLRSMNLCSWSTQTTKYEFMLMKHSLWSMNLCSWSTQTMKYEFMLMKYSNYEVWIYAHEVLKLWSMNLCSWSTQTMKYEFMLMKYSNYELWTYAPSLVIILYYFYFKHWMFHSCFCCAIITVSLYDKNVLMLWNKRWLSSF